MNKKVLLGIMLILVSLIIPLGVQAKEKVKIYLFEGSTCSHCAELKAFFGDFANNDFSNIKKISIKGMRCIHRIKYKNKYLYIYRRDRDNMHYMTYAKGSFMFDWDLNKENHQKLFWVEYGQELRVDCIEDNFKFEKYTMYDLIMNYKKFFSV